MAPITKLKTYQKKPVLHRRSSIEAFNALLAENLCKRKEVETGKRPKIKKPIEIQELPPPDANHHLIEDSVSRSWGFEDTFDRLCKAPVYDTAQSKDNESFDASKSNSMVPFLNSIHSPAVHNTRSRLAGYVKLEETPRNSAKKFADTEKTLDKSVNISLFIEKVPKFEEANKVKEITGLSSQSNVKLDDSHIPETNSITNCKTTDISYEPLFSNTFRERAGNKLHIASTPAVASSTPHKLPSVINETLSPILNCTEPKSLIEKSYEEIYKWNYKPPDAFESTPLILTPKIITKKKVKPKKLQKTGTQKAKHQTMGVSYILADNKRYSIRNYIKRDVKLKLEPRVLLDKSLDILGISKSVKMNLNQDWKGFSRKDVEQAMDEIVTYKNEVQKLECSVNKLIMQINSSSGTKCSINSTNSDSILNPQTPIRYVALRKRNVVITRAGTKSKTNKTDLELSTSKQNLHQSDSVVTSKTDSFSLSETSYSTNGLDKTSRSETNISNARQKSPTKAKLSNTSTKSSPAASESSFDNRISVPGVKLRSSQNRMSFAEKHHDSHKKVLRQTMGSPDIIPVTPPRKTSKRARLKKIKGVSKDIFDDPSYSSTNLSDVSPNCSGSINNPQCQKDVKHVITNSSTRGSTNNLAENSGSVCADGSNITDDIILVNSDDELFDDEVEDSTNQQENEQTKKQERMSASLASSSEESNTVEQDDAHNSALEFHNYSRVVQDDSEIIEVSSSDEECAHNKKSSFTPKIEHNTSKSEQESDEVEEEDSGSQSVVDEMGSPIPSTEQLNLTAADTSDETLFTINEGNEECSTDEEETLAIPSLPFIKPMPVLLKPGKSWRRSLLEVRRTSVMLPSVSDCMADSGCICTCTKCKDFQKSCSVSGRQHSVRILPQSPLRTIRQSCNASILENYAALNISSTYVPNKTQGTVYPERSIGEPVVHKPRNSSLHELAPHEVARDIVLRRCGQAEPVPFEECYPASLLRNCFKIGEGVYGEVFLFRNSSGGSSVMKVIPIEGSQLVNGEHQKKFDEILSEIVIAMELSNLRNDSKNKTNGFSEVEKIRCVQGCYPEKLLELWDLYEETRGSENDSPEMFEKDQLYIVLELANGGKDMESFVFKNSMQAYALFQQTACALAVAESALEFEHRDLHWGNVLISQVKSTKKFTYCLNGRELVVPACGIEVSIIDFTLSRIKCDGVIIYNDISKDPDLFSATGDYQFEIYELMQKRNGNVWEHFEPYTNILWLHYILDKMVSALRYSNISTKVHKGGIVKLQELKDRILKYSSVNELVLTEFAM